MDILYRELEKIGYLFYIVNPNKATFETIEEVPPYVAEVFPYLAALFFIEIIIRKFQRKADVRINEIVISLMQALMAEYTRIVIILILTVPYNYIYTNWRILTLPWNSVWTWWFHVFIVDFSFYLRHRAFHGINVLWAAHQVHHSSEEFYVVIALRNTAMQILAVPFIIPLALIIPPSALFVHEIFNLFYQYWIHTEVVETLGPLEYILNTPSHHRVHHGRNRKYIDKNYGGVFIIWDRIFGTFEAEKQEVIYGLTHPLKTYSPWQIQFHHYVHIWKTFQNTNGWKNKLSVLFKGPGWTPGSPWTGNIEDIPEVNGPIQKYDVPTPKWLKIYVCLHFLLLIFTHTDIMIYMHESIETYFFAAFCYQMLSYTCIAYLLERRVYAPWLELLRCFAYLALDLYFLPYSRIPLPSPDHQLLLRTMVRAIFICSSVFWLIRHIMNVTITLHANIKKID